MSFLYISAGGLACSYEVPEEEIVVIPVLETVVQLDPSRLRRQDDFLTPNDLPSLLRIHDMNVVGMASLPESDGYAVNLASSNYFRRGQMSV